MKVSRRDLGFLAPLLATAAAEAQSPVVPTTAYRYEDIPEKGSDTMRSRQMFTGKTHSGFTVDCHASELAPGAAPHAPHQHVHEEVLLIRDGKLDVTIGDKTQSLGAGSVVYLASNQLHGWRNASTSPARYFVFALGDDAA